MELAVGDISVLTHGKVDKRPASESLSPVRSLPLSGTFHFSIPLSRRSFYVSHSVDSLKEGHIEAYIGITPRDY